MLKSTRDAMTCVPDSPAKENPVERHDQPKIEYIETSSPFFAFSERLSRNVALAGMVLLTILGVRNASLPSGQTVLTAVQEMVEGNWDETLGKISFVGNFFPESVSVFFQSTEMPPLLATPCAGPLIHGYTANEPYLGYQCADGKVYAAAAGQVMSIAHGENEERILRIRHENGLETLYYQLGETYVAEGDDVAAGACIAQALPNQDVIMEVKRDGLTIDPTALLQERSTTAP